MEDFKHTAPAPAEGHEYSGQAPHYPAASQPASCSFSYPSPAFPQHHHPLPLPAPTAADFYYISPLRQLLYPAVDPVTQHFNSHQFVSQQPLPVHGTAMLPTSPASGVGTSRCCGIGDGAKSLLLPTENISTSISSGPSAKLTETALWRQFAEVGNEMIVTKPGRCIFPPLVISISGLHPETKYEVVLRLAKADNYRYKYSDRKWYPACESDIYHNEDRMVFKHPNLPSTGEFWMKQPISFRMVKITHYKENCKKESLLVHTMHKYVVQLDIIPVDQPANKTTVTLYDTTFTAVTSYQNTEIAKLKIKNNPFAKGFRDKENRIQANHSMLPFLDPAHYVSKPPTLGPPRILPAPCSWTAPPHAQFPAESGQSPRDN